MSEPLKLPNQLLRESLQVERPDADGELAGARAVGVVTGLAGMLSVIGPLLRASPVVQQAWLQRATDEIVGVTAALLNGAGPEITEKILAGVAEELTTPEKRVKRSLTVGDAQVTLETIKTMFESRGFSV